MQLEVKIDTKALFAALDEVARERVPQALAKALTDTAGLAKLDMVDHFNQVLDRPTPFTLASLVVKPATKATLVATLKTKDSTKINAAKWLAHNVEGGERPLKGFEALLRRAYVLGPDQYVVPGIGAQLDAYGNMKRSQIVAILADVQANFDPASNSTPASRAKRARRRTKRGGIYFAVKWKTGGLRPGIYEKTAFGFGTSVRPVMIFTKRQQYRPRIKFYETAKATVERRFASKFESALAAELLKLSRAKAA